MKRVAKVLVLLAVLGVWCCFPVGEVMAEAGGVDDMPVVAAKEKEKEKSKDGSDDLCDKVTDSVLRQTLGCGNSKTAPGLAKVLVNSAIGVAGIVAVGAIVYGGVVYVSSAGDPAKAKRGRDVLLYSVVGLVVAGLAYAIVNFVLKSVFT